MDVNIIKFFKKGDIVPNCLLDYEFRDKNITFKIDVIVKEKFNMENYTFIYKSYNLYPNINIVKYFSDFFGIPHWSFDDNVTVYTDPPGLKWRILNGC